ncbi:TPA: hypothetical protein ACH3X2_000646 [Trebouxia sp. C0005]
MTSQKERPNVLQLLRGDAVQEDSDSKKREQQPLVIEHFIRMKKALPEIKREMSCTISMASPCPKAYPRSCRLR